MKNRRIKCEVSKTIQERQYEPFQVVFTIEGDVDDKADIDLEFDKIYDKLEGHVFTIINARVE